jgi:hypothetical protein
MTHMNRRVAMGGLTASIAHELNQPWVQSITMPVPRCDQDRSGPRLDEVRDLEDIKHDDKRASEVLARIRRMLRKTDLEVGPLD